MMGCPVDDAEAVRMLELWGMANRIGGPKGYPNHSAHVFVPSGKDTEWTDHRVELVGWVVQHLDDDERHIVKMYFEPRSSGKRMSVHAISKKINKHHKLIHRAIDRCIGRVSAALSMPQYFCFENNIENPHARV